MPKMIFVNLPVTDVARSSAFYEALGFRRNEMFSQEGVCASMMWSDDIVFMLLSHGHFANFSPLPIADATKTAQVLLALSLDSREAVDAMTEAAAAHGGTADIREKQDLGFMYGRAFADPDGHIFEPSFMDMIAAQEAMGQAQPSSQAA